MHKGKALNGAFLIFQKTKIDRIKNFPRSAQVCVSGGPSAVLTRGKIRSEKNKNPDYLLERAADPRVFLSALTT